MSINSIAMTLTFVLAAGSATAQSVPAGDAQLAASAGVAAGTYSRAQMVQLVEARREGDASRVAFILSGGIVTVATRGSFVAASPVTAGYDLTSAELIMLDEARRDGDAQSVSFILAGDDRSVTSDPSVVTPAEIELAGIIGVDPASYTLSELVRKQRHP